FPEKTPSAPAAPAPTSLFRSSTASPAVQTRLRPPAGCECSPPRAPANGSSGALPPLRLVAAPPPSSLHPPPKPPFGNSSPLLYPSSSPPQLQHDLPLSGRRRRRCDPPRRGRRFAGRGGKHHRIRSIEIGVIQQVEEFGSQSQIHPLVQHPPLGERYIGGHQRGAAQDGSPCVAIGPRQRLEERVRIEILAHPTLDHGPRKVLVERRPHGIPRVAVVGRVVGKLRGERQTRLHGFDSTDLPP